MSDKKTLILCMDKNGYFFPYVKDKNIVFAETYKPAKSRLQYYAVKILKKVPYVSRFCYGAWKRDLAGFDKIVIFDEGYDLPIQGFLKRFPGAVYLYAWNPVVNKKTKLYRSVTKTRRFPIYSFEKKDCERYYLKYNSMVYAYDVPKSYAVSRGQEKYELFFVGYDKGRGEKIQQLKSYLETRGISCYLRIIDLNERMEYAEYLTRLMDAASILDVVQEGQNGMTIRVMESLFFEKKLVTTNGEIKDYDFYDPHNIFILGEDSLEDLPRFLKTDYRPLPTEIIEQYDVHRWLQRFEE